MGRFKIPLKKNRVLITVIFNDLFRSVMTLKVKCVQRIDLHSLPERKGRDCMIKSGQIRHLILLSMLENGTLIFARTQTINCTINSHKLGTSLKFEKRLRCSAHPKHWLKTYRIINGMKCGEYRQ